MHQHTTNNKFLSRHLLTLLALITVTVIVYLPVSNATLLAWDTQKYVQLNTAIHHINTSSLYWMLSQTYHANWHPLAFLSHAIDIQLFGFNATAHHWVNIAWHIACTCLIYFYCPLLLSELLPLKHHQDSQLHQQIASIAALLFAIHPQHVESAAWVAERKDLLCGFFYLLTLYLYHHYVKNNSPSRFLLCFISAALAFMAKPMAVSLPLILLLLDLLLYQRLSLSSWQPKQWLTITIEKIPFILFSMLSVILTLKAQSEAGAIGDTVHTSLKLRLATSITNWVDYLGDTLLPINLSPFYPYEDQIQWPTTFFCAFFIFLLFSIAEYSRRKGARWFMLSLLFYSITISPVIGIIQIGAIKAADRYAYLPTIPVYIIIASALVLGLKSLNNAGLKSALMAASLGLAILLGTNTHNYTKVWHSDTTLWEFVIAHKPDNLHANLFLAEAYYENGNHESALPRYRRAFSNREMISPDHTLNAFISRYSNSAYQLGFYKEAETVLNSGLHEQRLWSIPKADIYYNAALLNSKMANYEAALQLLNMAITQGYTPTAKAQALRARINRLKNNE